MSPDNQAHFYVDSCVRHQISAIDSLLFSSYLDEKLSNTHQLKHFNPYQQFFSYLSQLAFLFLVHLHILFERSSLAVISADEVFTVSLHSKQFSQQYDRIMTDVSRCFLVLQYSVSQDKFTLLLLVNKVVMDSKASVLQGTPETHCSFV